MSTPKNKANTCHRNAGVKTDGHCGCPMSGAAGASGIRVLHQPAFCQHVCITHCAASLRSLHALQNQITLRLIVTQPAGGASW